MSYCNNWKFVADDCLYEGSFKTYRIFVFVLLYQSTIVSKPRYLNFSSIVSKPRCPAASLGSYFILESCHHYKPCMPLVGNFYLPGKHCSGGRESNCGFYDTYQNSIRLSYFGVGVDDLFHNTVCLHWILCIITKTK